jgi:outer membrane protein assembly factor BamB
MIILSFDQDRPASFLLAVDARTGKERWRWEHEGYNNTPATPCLFFPPQGSPQVILATLTLGLNGVDAHSGKLIWQLPKLMKLRCVASPIVTDGGLIVAQCGEGPEDSSVEVVRPAADGQSAEKAYEIVRVGGHVPTPIALDGRLYLWKENGYVTCLREQTNEQVWSERVRGSFYGSPVCVNHRLYNMSTRGDLFVVAAGDQFQQIARIPLGEGSYATPAVSGGRMYLRTFTHLISVGK